MTQTLREIVTVAMHLPGGHTKVLVERTKGLGLAAGGTYWEIKTELIPPRLRAIGSRFVVVSSTLSDRKEAELLSPAEIREALTTKIEEIDE